MNPFIRLFNLFERLVVATEKLANREEYHDNLFASYKKSAEASTKSVTEYYERRKELEEEYKQKVAEVGNRELKEKYR